MNNLLFLLTVGLSGEARDKSLKKIFLPFIRHNRLKRLD